MMATHDDAARNHAAFRRDLARSLRAIADELERDVAFPPIEPAAMIAQALARHIDELGDCKAYCQVMEEPDDLAYDVQIEASRAELEAWLADQRCPANSAAYIRRVVQHFRSRTERDVRDARATLLAKADAALPQVHDLAFHAQRLGEYDAALALLPPPAGGR